MSDIESFVDEDCNVHVTNTHDEQIARRAMEATLAEANLREFGSEYSGAPPVLVGTSRRQRR